MAQYATYEHTVFVIHHLSASPHIVQHPLNVSGDDVPAFLLERFDELLLLREIQFLLREGKGIVAELLFEFADELLLGGSQFEELVRIPVIQHSVQTNVLFGFVQHSNLLCVLLLVSWENIEWRQYDGTQLGVVVVFFLDDDFLDGTHD